MLDHKGGVALCQNTPLKTHDETQSGNRGQISNIRARTDSVQ